MTASMQTTVSTPPGVAMPEASALVQAHSDANDALMLLFRVHRTFSRALTEQAQDALGVSATQARVLLCLAGSASIACADLARRLGWGSSHISRLVPALEKKHLITSRRCTIDRRTVRLSLTAAGAAIADRLPTVLHDSEQSILSVFDERERELLRILLCRVAVHGESAERDGTDCAFAHRDEA